MARIVMLQFAVAFCVTFIIAIITLVFSDREQAIPAAISALLGGLCCAIPNALFALRLYAGTKKPGGANPATFFIGEFLKIVATVALLAAVIWLYRDVRWLAFL